MIRAIFHGLPVTSSATRSSAARLAANASSTSGRVAIRPADRTLPSSAIATTQKSRCTSSPIALTRAPFADVNDTGEPWANDTDGSALAAQPGQSQGRPPNCRALTPILESGLPTLRSPEGPESQFPDRNPRPGRRPRDAFSCPELEHIVARGAYDKPPSGERRIPNSNSAKATVAASPVADRAGGSHDPLSAPWSP